MYCSHMHYQGGCIIEHISIDISRICTLIYIKVWHYQSCIKFNNVGIQHSNWLWHLFHAFYCTTWHIFEFTHVQVHEPSFNTDKYSIYVTTYIHSYGLFTNFMKIVYINCCKWLNYISCTYLSNIKGL